MKLILKILIISLFGLVQIITLSAQQNPQPYFRNYSTEHGLPSPEVYCALEDSKGYMWFGTDNGIARFDGYQFKTFGAKEGLLNNVVFEIHEDTKGRIWFGTMFGEAYIYEDGQIKPYLYNEVILKHTDKKSIGYLKFIDIKKNVWIEIQNKGILKIDSLGKDTLYSSKKPSSFFLFKNQEESPALFTVVSDWKSPEYKKYYKITTAINDFLEVCIDTMCREFILPFYNGKLGGYIGTILSSGHILIHNHGTLSCIYENQLIWQMPFQEIIIEIIEDNEQTIWFCTKKGLRRYKTLENIEKEKFECYLSNNFISNFIKDSKNGIWGTTINKGIFYCNNWSLLNYNKNFGLSDNYVNSIAFKNNSELFARCKNGDIFHIDINKNRVLKNLGRPIEFGENDLFYDTLKNRIWAGGFFLHDNKWVALEFYNPFNNEVQKLSSRKLINHQYNNSNNLVANHSTGFKTIDLKNNSIVHSDLENRITNMFISKRSKSIGLVQKMDYSNLEKINFINRISTTLLLRTE